MEKVKKVLMLYVSGCAGANSKGEIFSGHIVDTVRANPYLCDAEQTDPHSRTLISPIQQGQQPVRIHYDILELPPIDVSTNMTMDCIKSLVTIIQENYLKYDAFMVLCGFDLVVYVSTLVSFMLENLGKCVIFTGGYLPLSFMRNDTANNIVEAFTVIAMIRGLRDVVIVCKNKVTRANRSLKIKEGEFDIIDSPNLEPLVSLNIQISCRSHLFLRTNVHTQFTVFKGVSTQVQVLKMHIFNSYESLQYQLSNPFVKGYVIESFGPGFMPDDIRILNLFKQAHEQRNKVFLNVSQTVKKVHESTMSEYLRSFHIVYGGDITTEAALAKLAYLLGKYPFQQVEKHLDENLRGQITVAEQQRDMFEIGSLNRIKSIESDPQETLIEILERRGIVGRDQIERAMALQMVPICTSIEFRGLFNEAQMKESIKKNNLLKESIVHLNRELTDFLKSITVQFTGLSPAYYALKVEDYALWRQLVSSSGKMEVEEVEEIYQLCCRRLSEDKVEFFAETGEWDLVGRIEESTHRSLIAVAKAMHATRCAQWLEERLSRQMPHR